MVVFVIRFMRRSVAAGYRSSCRHVRMFVGMLGAPAHIALMILVYFAGLVFVIVIPGLAVVFLLRRVIVSVLIRGRAVVVFDFSRLVASVLVVRGVIFILGTGCSARSAYTRTREGTDTAADCARELARGKSHAGHTQE